MMTHLAKAFRLSLPVLGAYLFLGMTYGLLAASMGYTVWYPMIMAMLIYSGSVEFIALTMLLSSFQPLAALAMALLVGARHLFYGIAMLTPWRHAGWRKPLLVFWMTDETFAVNHAAHGPLQQQLLVSLLDYLYWLIGGLLGFRLHAVAADTLLAHIRGLEFVITAMFVAIFMDDYLQPKSCHRAAWLGVGAASACLILFGPDRFTIPTMMAILAALYASYWSKRERGTSNHLNI